MWGRHTIDVLVRPLRSSVRGPKRLVLEDPCQQLEAVGEDLKGLVVEQVPYESKRTFDHVC